MKRLFKSLLSLTIILAIAVVVLRGLFPLPDITGRAVSMSVPASADTNLGRHQIRAGTARAGLSGVLPLSNGTDALVSRLALADAAEATIDAQYYIWHDDTSGILLLDALRRAADRGVRVRLLLDDNGVPGLDGILATLNALDGFEVRLFNPSTVRSLKMFGYTFDFFRMNRRMHNKSFLADGAAAIIGGRNIGDEYFQVGDDVFYVDMDVLATGAIVPETAAAFDDYWNSTSVHAADTVLTAPADLQAFDARVTQIKASASAKAFDEVVQRSAGRYARQSADLEWTTVQLIVDDPVKGQGIARRDQLMIARLGAILGETETQLDLASAYFIPGQLGTDFFTTLAEHGKTVRILTNALNTTDVILVHAGYTKYRRALLDAGVDLYELKLRGDMTPEADLQLKPIGLSGASLHAKTFAVDQQKIFIGSFNFDPRSAMLNCEMGFLIDSPRMAARVAQAFDTQLDTLSYRPALTPDNRMIWREAIKDADTLIYQQEPGASWLQQVSFVIIGWLPIEWLL